MNDIAELKEYVEVHARSQRIPRIQEILGRIHSDDEAAPGSWVREWSRVGEQLELRGKHLEASRHYAMARFPYVDGPARAEVLQRCVHAMEQWRTGQGIERLDVELDGGKVRCLTTGLSTSDPKPLVIVLGGIVTIKEQWTPILNLLRKFGVAGLVTEMPSVGENTIRYQRDSWRMFPGLLDAVAGRALTAQTYAVALSFSGHMALRCAAEDPRIRGVVTVGAPISAFFTDESWQQQLPRITVDTLAHMTGSKPDDIRGGGLADWALTRAELGALDIPVGYTASLRDRIIPAEDTRLLRSHLRRLDLVEIDDVHGLPNHTTEVQLWTAACLLRARGISSLPATAINLLLRGMKMRRRITAPRNR